jgi:hypothetical protein
MGLNRTYRLINWQSRSIKLAAIYIALMLAEIVARSEFLGWQLGQNLASNFTPQPRNIDILSHLSHFHNYHKDILDVDL